MKKTDRKTKEVYEVGDFVARYQGKHLLDTGMVTEAKERYQKKNGWYEVFWNGLKRKEIVHHKDICLLQEVT
jgi:hypothetical protein